MPSSSTSPRAETVGRDGARRYGALFSYGFRPFFLFGSLYAAAMIGIWVPWFLGFLSLPTAYPPVPWHVHELLFGYVAAAMTGFLLTAVPNWTGRDPVAGWPLVILFGLWLTARAAVNLSSTAGLPFAAGLSLAFLVAVVAVVGREIVASGNRRNMKVLVLVGAFAASEAVFSWEIWRYGQTEFGDRLAIASALSLLILVGGRIVPSFTGNWLRSHGEVVVPPSFSRYDLVAVVVGAVGLVLWAAGTRIVPAELTGSVLLTCAALQLGRQFRWRPHRILADPLVAVLHCAYLFVPIGFALAGLAAVAGLENGDRAAIHAWTVGAIGTMTLAVMTRATLGHTGRALRASLVTVVIYVSVIVSAVARIIVALAPEWTMALTPLAGLAWIVAFLGFAAAYGPMLLAPRRPG